MQATKLLILLAAVIPVAEAQLQTRPPVLQLSLKQAVQLIVLGLIIGLAGSIAAGTLLRNLLFGTQAWDAFTLAAVVVVLGTSAVAASYLPARRAASVNPLEALRAE